MGCERAIRSHTRNSRYGSIPAVRSRSIEWLESARCRHRTVTRRWSAQRRERSSAGGGSDGGSRPNAVMQPLSRRNAHRSHLTALQTVSGSSGERTRTPAPASARRSDGPVILPTSPSSDDAWPSLNEACCHALLRKRSPAASRHGLGPGLVVIAKNKDAERRHASAWIVKPP